MSSAGSNGLDQNKRDELLQRFMPVHVFSYSSVRGMKEQEIGLRKVAVIHVCSQCDYQTPSRRNLVRHNMTHTGEKPFQCETCQRSFSQKSSLNSHMKTHQVIREKPSKRFECDICDHKATTKQNLTSHRTTHTGERPFKCDVCDFSLTRKEHLITHMRIHNDEKPFECEYCSYRCNQRWNLTQHMRTCKERPTCSKQ